MALLIDNTFEGGTPGVAFSSGNSGGASGTAASGLNAGSGNTWTYDDTNPAHGGVCLKTVWGGTASGYAVWPAAAAVGERVVVQWYDYFSAVPLTDGLVIFRSASADIGAVRTNGTGNLYVASATATTIAASTAPSPLEANVRYRFQFAATPGTTTSNGTLELYVWRDGIDPVGTPWYSWSSNAVNAGTAGQAFVRVGKGVVGNAYTRYFDSFRAETLVTGLIDPVSTTQTFNINISDTVAIADSGEYDQYDAKSSELVTITDSVIATLQPSVDKPTLVQQTTAISSSGSTNMNFYLPVASTVGNLLIAVIAQDKNTAPIQPPAGWNIIFENVAPSVTLAFLWKIANGETHLPMFWGMISPTGGTGWIGEYSQSGSNPWGVISYATNISNDSNNNSWSTGTTPALTSQGISVVACAIDSGQSATTNGAGTFTNGYVTAYSHLGPAGGGRGAVHVATKDVGIGDTSGANWSYVGTADQITGATAVFGRIQPPAAPDANLWFKKSIPGPKKVFGHYFAPHPRSRDNLPYPDFYDEKYLTTTGENSIHANYGGFFRDRPLERAPIDGDYTLEDMKWEIQTAQAMGFDGFFANITSITGDNWNRYLKLVDAAVALNTDFYIIPMIDTNGAVRLNTAAEVATALGYFWNKSSTYLENDEWMISTFKCEGYTTTKWSELFAEILNQYGVNVAFAGILLNASATNITTYAPISRYLGSWTNGADPATTASTVNQAALAPGRSRTAGVKWFGQGLTQIVAAFSQQFDEAANTGGLRGSWEKIIRENADHVQQITWNDFSEGGHLTPSAMRGWGPAAITAYYIEKWKSGVAPVILTDALILSHRDQPLSATYQSGQTLFMNQISRSNVTTPRDLVEALTYLTAPATVNISIGGVAQTPYVAPAGEYVQTFPNALGTISGTVVRDGQTVATITSPIPVTNNPVSFDRQYVFASSLHGTTGQRPVMILGGSGLSAVTKSLALSWNVLQAITKAHSQTFNVYSSVIRTFNQTFNVYSPIIKTHAITWNVLSSVIKSHVNSWNVLTSVNKPVTITWNVLGEVTQSLSSSWNVLTFLNQTLTQNFNVYVETGAALPNSWNVRQALLQSLSQTFNIRQAVTKNLSQTFNVRQAVVASLPMSWNTAEAITPVQASFDMSWDVRASVSTAFTHSYNVRSSVIKTLAHSLNVQAQVIKTLPVTFNTNQYIQTALATSWNVQTNAQVVSSFPMAWNVLETVVDAEPFTYNVLESVVTSLSTTWNVRTSLIKSLAFTHNVRTSLIKSHAQSFNVLSRTSTLLSSTWNVNQQVFQSFNTSWVTQGQVVSSLPMSWNTEAIGAVANSLPISFNVNQSLVASFPTSWNVLQAASTSLSQTFNVRSQVSKPLAISWGVRSALVASLSHSFNVRQALSTSLPMSWDIDARVFQNLAMSWNVIALQELTASFPLRWNVLTTTGGTLPISWNVLTSLSKPFSTTWNVRRSVLTSYAMSWHVLRAVITSITQTYRVLAQVTTDYEMVWNVSEQMLSQFVTNWDTYSEVEKQFVIAWSIRVALVQQFDMRWNTENLPFYFSIWDGTKEIVYEFEGVWDGTQVVPVSL